MAKGLEPIRWEGDSLFLLDQTKIPREKSYTKVRTLSETVKAIKEMVVRGAPAIAITGIFGASLGFNEQVSVFSMEEVQIMLSEILESRPTAVNLSFALDQLRDRIRVSGSKSWTQAKDLAIAFGQELLTKDLSSNRELGSNGALLFNPNPTRLEIVTHCNTGALATGGHGTALGVIRSLKEKGHDLVVYADETRPFLQGSRLTAFEMMEEGIECFIITDGMSGWLLQNKKIDAVLVGCDRIAKNGDVANKIGTYNLALVAKAHKVPFYVCATRESFDLTKETGKDIPIEMRTPIEVTEYSFLKGKSGDSLIKPGDTSPVGAKALNPSFDITPYELISGYITEFGNIQSSDIPNVTRV